MDGIRTPLYETHISLGGKMVSFGGFLLPVYYTGINFEHKIVRSKVGLFDVSHMGEFIISGNDAHSFLQKITINNLEKITIGQAQYTAMCYDNGGIVDDLLVYKDENKFMLVVNASNIDKNMRWLKKNLIGDVKIDNISKEMCLLAIQGPKSREVLQTLTDINLTSLSFYHFLRGKIPGFDALISRTGYTGELGFELYIGTKVVEDLWNRLLDAGSNYGIHPVGLGCRDTLRLEMTYPLYGNDIDKNTNPLESGLGWITKLSKDFFIGKNILEEITSNLKRRLVCIEMNEKSIPRNGCLIYKNNNLIGKITSGTMSPSLSQGIGLGYVSMINAQIGTEVEIDIRGNRKSATVIKPPFYKKGSLMD